MNIYLMYMKSSAYNWYGLKPSKINFYVSEKVFDHYNVKYVIM